MPARDQQQQIGRLQAFREADGERVRFQVIDRNQRQLVHQRHRFGGRDPDQQAANQSRPGRHRHASKVGERHTGLAQSPCYDLVETLHMRAGGDLRHHAAIAAVLFPLRPHDVGQDAPAAVGARATTAAAVSSQLVSMPSTSISRLSGVVSMGVVCTSARTGA